MKALVLSIKSRYLGLVCTCAFSSRATPETLSSRKVMRIGLKIV
jgi:hypothetical protein